jgi:hypothetical protein
VELHELQNCCNLQQNLICTHINWKCLHINYKSQGNMCWHFYLTYVEIRFCCNLQQFCCSCKKSWVTTYCVKRFPSIALCFFLYTANSKILSKKKILVSSKTWLEIRYQVNFHCLAKQKCLLKTSTYVVAKKRRGNMLLARNSNLLKTSINSPTEKQLGPLKWQIK